MFETRNLLKSLSAPAATRTRNLQIRSLLKGMFSPLQSFTFSLDIVESHVVFQVVKLQGFTGLKQPLAIQKLYKKRHGFYIRCSEACNFLILKEAKQHNGLYVRWLALTYKGLQKIMYSFCTRSKLYEKKY